MLRLKLIHVSKRGPWSLSLPDQQQQHDYVWETGRCFPPESISTTCVSITAKWEYANIFLCSLKSIQLLNGWLSTGNLPCDLRIWHAFDLGAQSGRAALKDVGLLGFLQEQRGMAVIGHVLDDGESAGAEGLAVRVHREGLPYSSIFRFYVVDFQPEETAVTCALVAIWGEDHVVTVVPWDIRFRSAGHYKNIK